MPSPLTHLAAGYAVYQLARKQFPHHTLGKIWKIPGLLLLAAFISILPDMDSVLGILLQDFGSFHNQGSHSLIVGLGVAVVVGGAIRLARKGSFWGWFFITLIAYEGHVLLDYFTWGRGVMLFWPLTAERFKSPLLLFYGLHWSDGLFSLAHIITFVTEMGLILLVYVIVTQVQKFRREKEFHDRSRIN